MARYADQLPINLAPNGANFLLATNDSDGKALERIPLELVVGVSGGGSTEYTILDQTALDVDSNIVLSAGLYLYVGNAPANLDLSGLVDGQRVEIINHTAHKVYLFGFTNWVWNGTTTALQTDKGLIVEKGGIIGAKHSGNLLLFNTLPNGLRQGWRKGLGPVDPYDENVILRVSANSFNGDTAIVDSSSANRAITRVGTGVVISTAQFKYGGSSLYFPGDGSYLSLLSIQFTGAFTIEAFVYRLDNGSYRSILSVGSYGNGILFRPHGGNGGEVFINSSVPFSSFTDEMGLNRWCHIALTRDASNVVRFYIDGLLYSSTTVTGIINSSGSAVYIGASYHAPNENFYGYVDSLRLTQGVARYTESNFSVDFDTYLDL